MASDLMPEGKELDWVRRLSKEVGRPITFALLQNDLDPTQWRRILDITEEANNEGAWIVPQVAGRPAGLLLGLAILASMAAITTSRVLIRAWRLQLPATAVQGACGVWVRKNISSTALA